LKEQDGLKKLEWVYNHRQEASGHICYNRVDMPAPLDTLDKKKRFIEFYSRPEVQGNISMTCDAVGINRQTYYNWLEKDEKFRKAMYEAKMKMCDEMEQILISRAVEKSDTALIFWLKYNHPQYKENPQVQINQQFNTSEMKVNFINYEPEHQTTP